MFHQSRRVWLIAAVMLCAAFAAGSRATLKAQQANAGWSNVPTILSRIVEAQLHSTLPQPQHPDRRRDDQQLADVGDSSRALLERDSARRDCRYTRPEQRRLQS